MTKVLREGKFTEVPSVCLVKGDVIMLKPGDVAPADVEATEQDGQAPHEALKKSEKDKSEVEGS